MDETQYDEFNNGVVTADGALVSTKPLADGAYNVIAWDGTEGTPPADATLTVSGGGTVATPVGVVFTVKLPSTQVRTYQIERITPDEEGTFNIEAVHMPTNASGVLELANGFDTAGNWVIE
jgi:predicted phage tail protein